jgi:hypothetical protein
MALPYILTSPLVSHASDHPSVTNSFLLSSFRAAMYSSSYFISVLSAFLPTLSVFAAAAPLCSDTINTAGGGPPNSAEPYSISANAVKEFQLALFLENLESFYFQTGLQNVSNWGTNGHPHETVEILSKIAAVSFTIDSPISI